MIITGRVHSVATWCGENISEQVYYLPASGYVRIGGVGWEVRSRGTNVDLYCKDETLATFLTLKYGVTVRVLSPINSG